MKSAPMQALPRSKPRSNSARFDSDALREDRGRLITRRVVTIPSSSNWRRPMKKSPRLPHFTLAAIGLVLFTVPLTGALRKPPRLRGCRCPPKPCQAPTTVSPQMQKIIGIAAAHQLGSAAQDRRGMEAGRGCRRRGAVKNVPGMLERLKVKVEKTTIDGVRAFIVTPEVIAPENRNRLLDPCAWRLLRAQPRRGRPAGGHLHGRASATSR